MSNTTLKEKNLKHFEPALRRILGLNSGELIHFNNSKKLGNAMADIVYFKDGIAHFIKYFPSYSQYGYTVPLEKYQLIKDTTDLDWVLLSLGNGLALIEKDEFLKMPYRLKVAHGIKQLHFSIDTVSKYVSILNSDTESKTLSRANVIEGISRYYTKLTLTDGFLEPDRRLGKLFNFLEIDENGEVTNTYTKSVSMYVETIYGSSTDDNAKAKMSFNQKVRRYIKNVEASFTKGERIEPLVDVVNSKDINVYILSPEMFATVYPDFFQYQKTHKPHVNKTADMKEYQKEYQKTDKYKEYKKEYYQQNKVPLEKEKDNIQKTATARKIVRVLNDENSPVKMERTIYNSLFTEERLKELVDEYDNTEHPTLAETDVGTNVGTDKFSHYRTFLNKYTTPTKTNGTSDTGLF